MITLKAILFASGIFALCHTASIADRLEKCKLDDSECWTKFFNSILKEKNGYPEIGVPPIDPYELKNMEVIVLGLIKSTLDGTAKGLSTTCNVNKANVRMEEKKCDVELFCDEFAIEGHYKIEKTPALTALLGKIDIHGDGEGKAVIEKAKVNVEFGFEVKKLDDGELHFQVLTDDTQYTFKVGKITVAANNIMVGSQDISEVGVKIVNENSETAVKLVGDTIVQKILDEFYEHVGKLLRSLAAKDITTEDVSSYV